jgi:hypothetical protein
MQTRKASPKQGVHPFAPLPVQPLTEKEMSSVSGEVSNQFLTEDEMSQLKATGEVMSE